MPAWSIKEALIVVRTYPTPSEKEIEVSCTAGITLNGEWLRLFPVPYRYLKRERQFRKYDWIRVRVKRASDSREESFNPDPDSIQVISHMSSAKRWAERKKFIYRVRSPSLCWLQAQQDQNPKASTLGIFKPAKIKRLVIEPEDDPNWTPDQLAKLRRDEQAEMFESRPSISELEKIPLRFSYEFSCEDSACRGHFLLCTDWEMGEAYRQWRSKYGPIRWEAKFREKFERDMTNKYETHFYVGTVHLWPKSWIIVGLFYPPLENQPLAAKTSQLA